jgi:hypothetical protein
VRFVDDKQKVFREIVEQTRRSLAGCTTGKMT